MNHLSDLKDRLRNSIRKLGLMAPENLTDPSLSMSGFDQLHLERASEAPKKLPALFASRERNLGDPARLFAGAAYGKTGTKDLVRAKIQWLGILEDLKPYGLRGRIAGINGFLNRSADTGVLAGLGRNLPWTGPLRLFRNAGSEHVAFAKYLSLRKIGISARRLRLVWIEDRHGQNNRVVLAVTFADRNYILDNRSSNIVTDDTLDHYRPYCSASAQRFSLHWDGREKAGWETSLRQLGSHALH